MAVAVVVAPSRGVTAAADCGRGRGWTPTTTGPLRGHAASQAQHRWWTGPADRFEQVNRADSRPCRSSSSWESWPGSVCAWSGPGWSTAPAPATTTAPVVVPASLRRLPTRVRPPRPGRPDSAPQPFPARRVRARRAMVVSDRSAGRGGPCGQRDQDAEEGDGGVVRHVGDRDGFGRYGILEETPDGLLCHGCGGSYAHLGLHVARADGPTAAYRLEHGLSRRRGLVSTEIRAKQAANAAGSTATQEAPARSRDTARAAASGSPEGCRSRRRPPPSGTPGSPRPVGRPGPGGSRPAPGAGCSSARWSGRPGAGSAAAPAPAASPGRPPVRPPNNPDCEPCG